MSLVLSFRKYNNFSKISPFFLKKNLTSVARAHLLSLPSLKPQRRTPKIKQKRREKEGKKSENCHIFVPMIGLSSLSPRSPSSFLGASHEEHFLVGRPLKSSRSTSEGNGASVQTLAFGSTFTVDVGCCGWEHVGFCLFGDFTK